MTTTLTHLAAFGLPEHVTREHSMRWIQTATEAISRRRRHELADQLQLTALATAVGQGDKDAATQLEQVMTELIPADEDPSLTHLLDPGARTDLASITNLSQPQPGMPRSPIAVQRVKVTPEEPLDA